MKGLLMCCLVGAALGCAAVRPGSETGSQAAFAFASGRDGGASGDRRLKLTLDNGLEVLLEENHSAPVVAFQAWVKSGAADEPPELAGVSHFLEHMLFKGTARRGVGRIAQEVEGAGGEINAWTSYDETVFHLVMASAFFDTGLDILADSLTSSSFDAAELERERNVILEEIKQGLDDPDRVAAHALFDGTFAGHPYARPVIGAESTVAAMKRDDIVGYYRSHYVASNVVLVVVGDFDAADAQRKIQAAFGGLRSGRAPNRTHVAVPPSNAPRVRVLARDVKETQLMLGFRVPSVEHDDIPALDLLTVVLGQGDSSRLNLEIVRNRQLVTSAHSYLFSSRDGGIAVVGANLSGGRVDEAARAVIDEALRLAREEISPEELAKARTILESDRVFDKETVQGYARKLGFFAAIAGDPAFESRYFAKLSAITPAELRTVAARYLRMNNATLLAQVPEAKPEKQADRVAKLDARLRPLVDRAEARADSRFARVDVAATTDAVVRKTLPSGVKLLVLRDRTVPIVAVRALWLGGLRHEDARTNGISNFLAALLTRGTKNRSAEQIMHEVEGMAGSLSGYSGRNSLGVQAEFLSRHWQRGLELLADCLLNASFSDEEIERERRIVLDDLRAQEDNLAGVAFRLFHASMWKRHPYRFDQLGTPDSVASFSRRKLLTHYRRFYGLRNLTISIVGDVDPPAVIAKLGALFGEGPAVFETADVPQDPPPAEPVQAFKFLNREQAHVVIGYPGTTLDSPDRFALEVLAQVLSGQGGRLFVEIRERRALAYRVSAFSLEGIDPGYFAVYVATSPANLEEAVTAMRAELKRLVADGITPDELERARRYLTGTHSIGLQRKSAVAAALAFHEAYDGNWREYKQYPEKIARVTLADVKRVATKYLDGAHEVTAVIKPSDATPAAVRGARASAARAP